MRGALMCLEDSPGVVQGHSELALAGHSWSVFLNKHLKLNLFVIKAAAEFVGTVF